MCLNVAGTCPLSSLGLVPVISWVSFLTLHSLLLYCKVKRTVSFSELLWGSVSLILSLPTCAHFFSCMLETPPALGGLSSRPSQIALKNTSQSFVITTDRKPSLENLFPLLLFCFSIWLLFFKLTLTCGFLLQPPVLGLPTCTDCTTSPNCDALLEFVFLFVFVCLILDVFVFVWGGWTFWFSSHFLLIVPWV